MLRFLKTQTELAEYNKPVFGRFNLNAFGIPLS